MAVSLAVRALSIRTIAVPLLVAGLTWSCIGDPNTDILIENGTGKTLVVREVGVNSGADLVTMLPTGGERITSWRFRTGESITLMATEPNGPTVFCHRYTYAEVRPTEGRIQLQIGKLDCR